MALRFIDSFDHYVTADLTEKYNAIAASPTISAGNGRRGTASLRLSSATVAKTLDNQSTWIVGMAFRVASIPSSLTSIFRMMDASTWQVSLDLDANGTLVVRRNGTTALTGGTSSRSLQGNIFYYIEWKCTIANSIAADSCVVRVDGVPWLTVTAGQDTQQSANAYANQIVLASPASTSDIDDVYICDGTGAAPYNDFLGDCRVDALLPNGEGSHSAWTPNSGTVHYDRVDETAPNDDTDYLSTSTAAARDSHTLTNLGSMTSPTIYAIQHCISAKKDDAGTRQIKSLLKSGATTEVGSTTHTLSTSYAYYQELWTQDPDTDAAWTPSGIDALEAGVENQ